MTFDDLLDWVDAAIARTIEQGVNRDRRNHVKRLQKILLRAEGDEELYARDWIALAEKVAALLGEPAPKLEGGAVLARPRPSQPPRGRVARASKSRTKRNRATKKRGESLEMNPQLERAFGAVGTGKPIVFVTGGAGTGKSTFIRALRERFHEKNSIVLAPTGVAALNAGGQTIHSFCKLPLRVVTPDDVRELEPDDRAVVEHLDLLVIDEVSMVRADILDGVENFLRVNRKSDVPFGGVQVVLVGDLFQLPPVVTSSDAEYLGSHYATPQFFSARCLQGLSFFPVELEIVYRQRDPVFANLLRDIRDGSGAAAALAEINRQCVGRALSGQVLTLVPTRAAAAEENARRLAAIKGRERRYEAAVTGTFATGDDDRLPAPRTLVLKPGAQVMFTRNDADRRWVNGTLGVVERLHGESIEVRLDDGEVAFVEPVEWENLVYTWDRQEKKIIEEVLGSFIQFPLMPAWAVTIHKAQGLTLARVAVDFGRGAFAEGQVYVALSRCQSLEGLSLARPVRAREVRCSEAAQAFYAKIPRREKSEVR